MSMTMKRFGSWVAIRLLPLCENLPSYARYRERTERNIEVVRLSPRDHARAA